MRALNPLCGCFIPAPHTPAAEGAATLGEPGAAKR
jgi:hypothetical protein